jgi:CRISPR-associated RAMP protein (TIGR02581 family)
MHKQLWNVLRLEFAVTPKAPLLIKSGMLSPNPSLPDTQFVRTITANGETVFIPGSSLKGVFRSFSERILRTLNGGDWACDPLDKQKNCEILRLSKLDKKAKDYTAQVYANSCCACKLYGNTCLRGRVAFADAFPDCGVKTETRYGVAISRLTNAVAHGPFDMEIVVAGAFRGSLTVGNFEVWQLGLLALTIRALNDGLVRIGFGKNRGFGEVTFTVTQVALDLAKANSAIPPDQLWGIGKFVNQDERQAYGLREDDLISGLSEPLSVTDLAVSARRTYSAEGWQVIAEKAIQYLPIALEVRR